MQSPQPPAQHSHARNMALWATQVFVTVAFWIAAAMKLGMPIPKLASIWPWAGQIPPLAVRTLGLIDLAGGAGVLLPWLTQIRLGLTPVATLGCMFLQVCAMVFHASRGELGVLPVNVILFAACGFIYWGRKQGHSYGS